MLRPLVEAMRRSTRRALANARLMRRRQIRAMRRGLHRQRLAALSPVNALAERVRDVLEAHPEGIDAREIGNELGVDWRSVTAVTSSLVASGAADQIDQDFYPSGKGSRRC
jgi:hypothetical protein